MPRRCAVLGCPSKGVRCSKSFYRFPSDQELCKKWLKALCNLQLVKMYEKEGYLHLNKNRFVCSDHFEAKHMRNARAPSQGLFEGAVPSINLNLNMDALISSLRNSDILNEVSSSKKKVSNVPLKRSKEKAKEPEKNKQTEEISQVKNVKQIPTNNLGKTNLSPDDIPLKALIKKNVKVENNDELETTGKENNSSNKDKVKTKINKVKIKIEKMTKRGRGERRKEIFSIIPNKIEQVFLPSSRIADDEMIMTPKKKKLKLSNQHKKIKTNGKKIHLKKKKKVVQDPLEDNSSSSDEPLSKCVQRKVLKIKKLRKKKIKRRIVRKKRIIRKRKIFRNGTEKLIKVVIVSKNIDSKGIKFPSEGPNKIIKVVIPSKTSSTGSSETTQSRNKIIKVVVPKTRINGREINLEKSEINKILKLVSVPKIAGGKVVTESSEINKILERVSIPKSVNTIRKNVNITNDPETTRQVSAAVDNVNTKEVQIVSENFSNTKILKAVPPPRNIDGKQIKVITLGSDGSKFLRKVPPPRLVDGMEIRFINPANSGTILRKVPPPKVVDGMEIKLINPGSDNVKILNNAASTPVVNNDGKELRILDPVSGNTRVLKQISPPKIIERNSCDINNLSTSISFSDILNNESSKSAITVNETTQSFSNTSNDFDNLKSSIQNVDNNKTVKEVYTPKTIRKKGIQLGTQDFDNDVVEVVPPTPTITDFNDYDMGPPNTISDDSDVDNVDLSVKVAESKLDNQVLETNKEVENNVDQKPVSPKPVTKVEIGPVGEELCKRIQGIIGKRFGDDESSSDDEVLSRLVTRKKTTQKTIKQLVEKYRSENKQCSCDKIYEEKMKNLHEEEKELKKKLKNVQKYVFHYKDNIRKRTALVGDLRKQIPVKKTPKTGQLIKTVMPLDKIKDKTPGKYRFTKNLKSFALDLFYSSPLSYNILEKIYFLPSRKTLKNWVTNPKNENSDLIPAIDDNNEITGPDNMELEVDNHYHLSMSHHSMEPMLRHPEPIHHHHHHHHIETYDRNMGVMEDNIEPLQENIDDIMFRSDIAAAIMNT